LRPIELRNSRRSLLALLGKISMAKILFIEDDQFLTTAYGDKLTREGFEILTAESAAEGMQMIRGHSPDLIILDLVLPDKSGFELLEEVKSDESLNQIPIIVLSNLGQETDVKKAMQLGASGYFIKVESSLKKIIEKIKEILGKK